MSSYMPSSSVRYTCSLSSSVKARAHVSQPHKTKRVSAECNNITAHNGPVTLPTSLVSQHLHPNSIRVDSRIWALTSATQFCPLQTYTHTHCSQHSAHHVILSHATLLRSAPDLLPPCLIIPQHQTLAATE